jgi:acyl-CoA reductase-like NAD-dependent aldehyde dehydrogenase
MDIEKVAFTGGNRHRPEDHAGATGNIKGISLELGGKSPCIVFDDYELDTAVDWAMSPSSVNQGEVCPPDRVLILHGHNLR